MGYLVNEITVFLVDDNASFRQSTTWLLSDAGFTVNAFEKAEMLLAFLNSDNVELGQSCIVTDLRMPGMSGLALMEVLRQRRIRIPIVVVTGHGDVPMAVETMQRGAANFIEKPFESIVLVETILSAVSDPGSVLRNPGATREKVEKLSPREREVLGLVCAGKLNKTIADVLGISIKTVELHRSNMFSKLGVCNVQELVRLTLGYQ